LAATTVTLAIAAVACVAGLLTNSAARTSRAAEAERSADSAGAVLSRRTDQYVEMLRGLSGWIGQAGWPRRTAFQEYLRNADVKRRYPGMQVVGGAQLVERARLAEHAREVDADAAQLAYPSFAVHPDTGAAQSLPIDFIEPQVGNAPALGLDLLSEEHRRAAVERARDLGQPRATAPIHLVQDAESQPGILVMTPVYRPHALVTTMEQRRAAFTGVVYAAFRVPDLVNTTLGDEAPKTLLYDAGDVEHALRAPSSDNRLFGTGATGGYHVPFTIAGRKWVLVYHANTYVRPLERFAPWILAGAGILLALAAGLLILAVGAKRERAEARALAKDAQLVRERRHASHQLELLLDCSGEGICGIDLQGRITFANRRAAQLLGTTVESLLGKPAHETLHHSRADGSPYPIDACPMTDTLKRGRAHRVDDDVFWRPDGTALAVEYSVSPLEHEGVIEGAVETFNDITVRKRAEQALHDAVEMERQSAQRLREVDQTRADFVSTVSHELRTPLTSIGGYLELILDGDAGPVVDRQREMLGVAQRNTKRLLLLVEDLLTLSRIEAATFEMVERPVDVTALLKGVARTITPLASAKSQTFTVDIPSTCGTVLGDPEQLERAVLNLLSNAVKFTPEGGQLTLVAATSGERLMITIADNGVGIPQDEQGRLFQRFFRSTIARDRAIQGTGLGLSIVKDIIERHGGTIAAMSAEGRGTTMTIALPLVKMRHPAGSRRADQHQ
jgi:PAS domain S-box-containing protein